MSRTQTGQERCLKAKNERGKCNADEDEAEKCCGINLLRVLYVFSIALQVI